MDQWWSLPRTYLDLELKLGQYFTHGNRTIDLISKRTSLSCLLLFAGSMIMGEDHHISTASCISKIPPTWTTPFFEGRKSSCFFQNVSSIPKERTWLEPPVDGNWTSTLFDFKSSLRGWILILSRWTQKRLSYNVVETLWWYVWHPYGRTSGLCWDVFRVDCKRKEIFQENYNTPVEHTPGNPPSPLWKESLYSLLVKVYGRVPKVCWNNLRNILTHGLSG